jgi:hypothetical protein
MIQAVRKIESEPAKTVEVVIHISETLTESQRQELVTKLESEDHIASAEFCPLRFHLMLVRYNREASSSQDVLASVSAQAYNARLIGPI